MDLQASVDKILRMPDLGEIFYQVLFERFPETRAFFEKVEWKRQKIVFTMSVSVIAQHYLKGYPATRKYLAYLGTHHQQRGIPEAMLPHFRDALLEALGRALGADWSPELAAEWAMAIDLANREMSAGYRSHVTI
jgi:hemoglobin-like flavoprotein